MNIVPIALVVLALVFVLRTIKLVRQGEVQVIERLGKFHTLASAGLNVIVPFVDGVRAVLDLREQINEVEPQSVITRDNVTMQVDCVVYWQVLDPVRATYEVSNLRRGLDQLALSALRNVIGELDLDHTLTSRDVINSKIRATLDQATDRWGVKVTRVELKNIEPPAEIKLTMEKQMTAERNRRAQVTEAEGLKQAAILRAQGEQQSAVISAEGRRDAAVLDADGQAKSRLALAEAESESLRIVAQALGTDASRYLIASKYLESLKDVSRGATKTVLVPYEATSVLGSLGGIRELLGDPSASRSQGV